jgi:predicted outer membrane protein
MRSGDAAQRQANDVSQQVERFLAQCLITKNQGEVEFAQFAAQRAQNPQVKQYAERLVEDHKAIIQKLQSRTGAQVGIQQDSSIRSAGYSAQEVGKSSANSSQPASARDRAERTTATEQSDSRRPVGMTRTAENQSPELQELATIERQMAERAQQAFREKLQAKQGAEFDQCFVGSQVVCHMTMLASLEVIQQQASGQLQQIAQESHPKVKQHLDQAEQLAEQLMSGQNRQANDRTIGQPSPR